MRISDWSSDVCSSDLAFPVGVNGASLAGGAKQALVVPAKAGISLFFGPSGFCVNRRILHKRKKTREIGRASCRERVCSVRVDFGGRRIIKKKITTMNHNITQRSEKNQ